MQESGFGGNILILIGASYSAMLNKVRSMHNGIVVMYMLGLKQAGQSNYPLPRADCLHLAKRSMSV